MRKFLAALLLGPLAAAPSQSPEPQTFKIGTKLVEVDVVARDKRGPTTGLTKDDFTLLDNGKPQDIAFFSVKSVRGLAAKVPLSTVPALPPGVVSNRPNPNEAALATQTVLLLDQLFTSPVSQIFAIQRMGRFLDLRRKRDGIGIFTLGSSVRVVQDVTSDDALLRRAVKRLEGRDATLRSSDTTGMSEKAASAYLQLGMDERVLALKHALQATARHLASVPGRKHLIWISEGFPLLACFPNLPCKDYRPDMEEAARALNDANVALYAVDPRGLIGALGRMTGISNAESRGPAPQFVPGYRVAPVGPEHVETMNFLAGLTGGEAYYNTNGIEDSIQTAVEDGDVTYSLSFYPSEDSQDGKVHKLSVKVARTGVGLRYRENYLAPKPQSEAENRPSLDQLLKDPLDATQIGVLAQATPDQTRPGFFDVRVAVDLHGVQLGNQGGKWVGAVEISFHVEASNTAQSVTRTIEVPEDQLATALERGIVIDHSIEWQGKATDLRVVVVDKATGAAGSLRIPLAGK
jgi:VWFA-related protein